MAWDYFEEGQRIAGVRIMWVAEREHTQVKTVYMVRHDCCDAEEERSHKSLLRKVVVGNRLCKKCSAKVSLIYCRDARILEMKRQHALQDHPTWPVPPSVLADKRRFMFADRGGR